MKIRFSDETEAKIKRASEKIIDNTDVLDITFITDGYSMDEIKDKLTQLNVFSIIREDSEGNEIDNIVFKGYSYKSIYRNITDDCDEFALSIYK